MNTRCPDCGVAMQDGFLLDRGDAGMPAGAIRWVEGDLQTSFWTGVKTKGRQLLHVRALRCPECGLLRQYALPEPTK
jgi:hypothetical protein